MEPGLLRGAGASPKSNSHTPTTLLIIFLACIATLLCYRVFLKEYNSGLRNTIYTQLAELLPNTHVRIGSIVSDGPEAIILSDVRVFDKKRSFANPVFTSERIVLKGNLDIADWAQQTTRVQEVHLFGANLSVWPIKNTGSKNTGSWSTAVLKPHSRPGSIPPKIVFHRASVQVLRDSEAVLSPVVIHDINGEIGPQPAGQQKSASATGPADVLMATFSGRSSGLLTSVTIKGNYDRTHGNWQVKGGLTQLNFSAELLARLPQQATQYVTQLEGLECKLSGNFGVTCEPNSTPRFEVKGGQIADGRLHDARLPYPLGSIAGNFYCTNEILQLRSLSAQSVNTKLSVDADIYGFTPHSPVEIHAQAVDLELDSRLYGSLSSKLREQWDKMKLSGRVSGLIRLSYDGQKWTPRATLQCAGVAINAWLFPYPLTEITGPINFQDETLSSPGMVGMAGGQQIESSFSLSQQDGQWLGRIEGRTHGPVAIDEQMLHALTPRGSPTTGVETFVRSLRPTGAVVLKSFAFDRKLASEPRWSRSIDAHIYDASIRYDKFDYPITEVRGRIVGKDDQWFLNQFEGHNDGGSILCSGEWQAVSTGLLPFDLKFKAFGIPLEDELRKALPSDAQHVWQELQPFGFLDVVQVNLSRPPGESEIYTEVMVEEENQSNNVNGRSLRLFPQSFPYRLSNVECKITYTPGQVNIHHASGYNGSSRISMKGNCSPRADGRWQAKIDWLPQTRFIVDRELLSALPESIRQSLVKIDLRGPISFLGTSLIALPNSTYPKPLTSWNCQLDVENAMLSDGNAIGNMRGTVFMQGSSDGTQISGTGRVEMDALTVLDIPVSNLRGPFALLNSTLYFGSAVENVLPANDPNTDNRMRAQALAGELLIEGEQNLENEYLRFASTLLDAELSSLLQDVGVNRASTQAQCDATCNFLGVPWNAQTWSGGGNIHLSDAKLFELPFMIRLMRVASVSAQDDSAFQSADIGFSIDEDQIPLDISCYGDVLRLRGDGHTNLRRDIDLELYVSVGRKISLASVFSPMYTESSSAALMMIKVDGSLDNPEMQRRQFPQFASIQELFPELEEPKSKSKLGWRR